MKHWRAALILLSALCLPYTVSALSISGLKNDLVQFLLEKVSIPGQFEVRAGKVEDDGAGRTVLVDVGVYDARGQWFDAQRIALAWSPARLLRGEVQIDELEITRAKLTRLPEAPPARPSASAAPAAGDATTASAVSWPRSPITTYVKSVQLQSFSISDQVLPQALSFDAQGSARDEGDIQQLTLAIKRKDAVRGEVDVSYTKRFDNDTLELSIAASEDRGGLVAAATGLPPDVPSRLEVVGNGTSAAWQGTLQLEGKDFIGLHGSLQASWKTRIGATLALDLTPGTRLDKSVRQAIGKNARLRLAVEEDVNRTVRIKRAELVGAVLSASATGYLERDSGVIDLQASGQIDSEDARRLNALTRPLRMQAARFAASISGKPGALKADGRLSVTRPLIGSIRAQHFAVKGQAAQSNGNVNLSLDIDATAPTSSAPALAKALGDAARVRIRGQLRGAAEQRVLRLETMTLAAAGVEARASGDVALTPELTPNISYDARIAKLSPFSQLAGNQLAGKTHITGRLKPHKGQLRAKGTVINSNTTVNGARLGTVRMTHDLVLAGQIEGRLTADVESPEFGRGNASTRIKVTSSEFALSALKVDLLKTRATGAVRLSRTGRPPAGNLKLNIASLRPIGRLLALPVEGQASGELTLVRNAGGTARVRLAMNAFRSGEISLAEGLLDVAATKLTETPEVRGSLSLRQGGIAALSIERGRLEFDGPVTDLPVDLSLNGEALQKPVALRSQMRVAALENAQSITVRKLEGTFDGEAVTLRRPARLQRTTDGFDVRDLDLALPDDGAITVDLSMHDGVIRTAGKLARIPLRLANLVVPGTVKDGTLDASVRATSAGNDANLDLTADITGLRFESAPPGVKALTGTLRSAWDGRHTRTTFKLTGPFDEPLRVTLEVPLDARPKALPQLASTAPLRGAVKWRGETQALLEQLPAPDHLLKGQAVVDVQLAGTVDSPRLSGQVTLDKSRYENLASGTVLEQLQLSTQFDADSNANLKLRAQDGAGGTLAVDGLVRALRDVDLKVTMRKLLAVRLDQASAQVDGDLTLSGDTSALLLEGALSVTRAEVNLISQLPATVIDLGNVRVKGQASTTSADNDKPAAGRIKLDVAVDMNDRIFVRGRGLDSEWGGNLNVAGTAAQPLVTGKIAVRRGRFELLGRILKFAKGELRFDGGRAVDPSVDVRLEREANGIRGGVAVSGRASAPAIGFYSTPSLPRDEILPRLLFGRSSTSLSGAEALRLAAGVAALTSGQSDTMDKLRSALGLDVLTFESGDDAASPTSIAVGRYVHDGVYVGARQSLDGTSGSVVIEAEVFDNVVIDADVGQTGSSSVGVSWRKDF